MDRHGGRAALGSLGDALTPSNLKGAFFRDLPPPLFRERLFQAVSDGFLEKATAEIIRAFWFADPEVVHLLDRPWHDIGDARIGTRSVDHGGPESRLGFKETFDFKTPIDHLTSKPTVEV